MFFIKKQKLNLSNSERITLHILFDPQFYLEQIPNAAVKIDGALLHYLNVGWKLHLSPNRLFDEAYYIAHVGQLHMDIPPLLHYIRIGNRNNLSPISLFDPYFYKKQSGVNEKEVNTLAHYMQEGWKNNYSPHILFDVAWYLRQNQDVAKHNVEPLSHYLTYGWHEGRKPHALFDLEFYASQANILTTVEPLSHYLASGWSNKHNPHPLFNAEWYARKVQTIPIPTVTRLQHYLDAGWKNGLSPHCLFDTQYYLAANEDVRRSGREPLSHYLEYGWKESRAPNPFFSSRFYALQQNITLDSGANPLVDYVLTPYERRADPSPFFQRKWYIEKYLDVYETKIDPLEHYLEYGIKEERLGVYAREIQEIVENESLLMELLEAKCPSTEDAVTFLTKVYPYSCKRLAREAKLSGNERWRGSGVVVAFAVSEVGLGATRGDYFTALELGEALQKAFQWKPRFLSQQLDWYEMRDVDVLISMIDTYDLSLLRNENCSYVTVAWMRNWFDNWVKQKCFANYDIYLCSSEKSRSFLKECGYSSFLFPIATNFERFSACQRASNKDYACDYCFTGSNWGLGRELADIFDPGSLPYFFSVYGSNWADHKVFSRYWRGRIQYQNLPTIYASTKLVVDDANIATKLWGSINSRVFDALAAGSLVVTNNAIGSRELFDGKLPVYTNNNDLCQILSTYLEDTKKRLDTVNELQEIIREHHTYDHRANTLKAHLLDWMRNHYRIAIKIAVPNRQELSFWGDYFFALDLKNAFERKGHSVRIDILPTWYDEHPLRDDIVIVLRGLSIYQPRPGQINFLWLISHPEDVGADELNLYDHVFVASRPYTQTMREMTTVSVSTLLQCTEPRRFTPQECCSKQYDIIFVGNSRDIYREAVKECIANQVPVAIFGSGWEQFIDRKHICAERIPNCDLSKYYCYAKIVLCDHWEDMRKYGFVSNKIFDCIAAGGVCISDDVVDIDKLFNGIVPVFNSDVSIKSLVDKIFQDYASVEYQFSLLRKIIVAEHTFDRRVDDIIDIASRLYRDSIHRTSASGWGED